MKGKTILVALLALIVIIVAIIYIKFRIIFQILGWADGSTSSTSYSKAMTDTQIQSVVAQMVSERTQANAGAQHKGENYQKYNGPLGAQPTAAVTSGTNSGVAGTIPTTGSPSTNGTGTTTQTGGKTSTSSNGIQPLTTQDAKSLSQQYHVPIQRIETYIPYINQYAQRWDVPPKLIVAQMYQESGIGRPTSMKSSAGAYGIMQILVSTAQGEANQLGISTHITGNLLISNTALNIELGIFYDHEKISVCSGNLTCALQSYNEGFGAWQQGIHYSQAVAYAKDILAHYGGASVIGYSSGGGSSSYNPITVDPNIQLRIMAQIDFSTIMGLTQGELKNNLKNYNDPEVNKTELINTYADMLKMESSWTNLFHINRNTWSFQDWMMLVRKQAMECYLYGSCNGVKNLVPTQFRGMLLQTQVTKIHNYSCIAPTPPPVPKPAPQPTPPKTVPNPTPSQPTVPRLRNIPHGVLGAQAAAIENVITPSFSGIQESDQGATFSAINDVYQNPVINEYPQGKIAKCPAQDKVKWTVKNDTSIKYTSLYNILEDYGNDGISVDKSSDFSNWVDYYYSILNGNISAGTGGGVTIGGVTYNGSGGIPVTSGLAGSIVQTARTWAKKTVYVSGAGRSPGGIDAASIPASDITQNLNGAGELKADCSSFVWWMFKLNGISLNSNTKLGYIYTKTEVSLGTAINPNNESAWKPGDLIFFYVPGDSPANDGHVVIYMGNGWAIGDQSPKNGAYAFKVSDFVKWIPGSYVEDVRRIVGS